MEELEQEVALFRSATFSDNTKATYSSQLKSYLKFCNMMCVPPVPASEAQVSMYAAYLARRLSASSIKPYLNIIRLLHIENGYANPYQESWLVKSTIKGIQKTLGMQSNRKVPIQPSLLIEMHKHIDISNLLECMFWAAALVLFFGTFRKSNLLPNKPSEFSADKQFCRSAFVVNGNGPIEQDVTWSKTIQCKERSFKVVLPKVPDSVLCPVKAVFHAFSMVPLPPCSPAIVQDVHGTPLTGSVFNKQLKHLVEKCGLEPSQFSSHSFRRGSATWALQCGVPGEVVKLMGDWRSSVYLSYLDNVPQNVIDHYRNVFASRMSFLK